jgi:hypothetical protein
MDSLPDRLNILKSQISDNMFCNDQTFKDFIMGKIIKENRKKMSLPYDKQPEVTNVPPYRF